MGFMETMVKHGSFTQQPLGSDRVVAPGSGQHARGVGRGDGPPPSRGVSPPLPLSPSLPLSLSPSPSPNVRAHLCMHAHEDEGAPS